MSAGINLASLPVDVLFHIISFLDLTNTITFPLVCRSLNALSHKRSMWINALQRERAARPIACTTYEDLTSLDLGTLKRIAFHTLRLTNNWARAEPRVVGSIKAVPLGTDVRGLDLLFQVPAAELYVFHSRTTGEARTWHAGGARQVAAPLYVSRRVMDVSPGQERAGVFTMGLLTSESAHTFMDNKIVVICLEYGGPAGVKLSTTFSHKLAPNLSHWAIFMTDEYVGVLECSPDAPADGKAECIRLVAFNLKTGRQATIHTDMSGKDFALSHSGTSTIDGDVFILLEDKKQARITRIPKHYLPHDDNSDCPAVSTLKWEDNSSQYDIVPQDENDEFVPEGALSANDFYRAPAVSLHAVRPASVRRDPFEPPHDAERMQVRFWGAADADAPAPRLELQGKIDINGQLQDSPGASWKLMLLAHSGRCMLLVVDQGTHVELRLVRIDAAAKACSAHHLVVPEFIPLLYVYGLSIDDHLGVVTLLDTRGYMFAIPYA